MSDDNRAGAALRHFIAELNAAWEAAGPPSYARLEKLSVAFGSTEQSGGLRLRVLAASTTHEILRGKRRSLPEWAWVVSFVNVLRVAAVENGLNPDVVGTVAEWKAKHQAARLRMRGTRSAPAAAPAREDGAEPPDEEWPPGIGPPGKKPPALAARQPACSRAAARSRRSRLRSCSVVPPQMPDASPLSRAWPRHSKRTGQPAQICFASAI